jgi:hypothetical protein
MILEGPPLAEIEHVPSGHKYAVYARLTELEATELYSQCVEHDRLWKDYRDAPNYEDKVQAWNDACADSTPLYSLVRLALRRCLDLTMEQIKVMPSREIWDVLGALVKITIGKSPAERG